MGAKDTEVKEAQGLITNALSNQNNQKASSINRDYETFKSKTQTQIEIRDDYYSQLLIHFVELTKCRNWVKEIFKIAFYVIMIVGLWTLISIVKKLFEEMLGIVAIVDIMEYAPIIVTSLVSFVSAIIAVPTIIIQYLFNTKEDENITAIITHTQDHDTSGRTWIVENKESDGKEKKESQKKKDVVNE